MGHVHASHLQMPHSMEPLPLQRPCSRLWSRHWHSHWGRTFTVTVSVKPSARMTKDCSWMHLEAVTFTWKVTYKRMVEFCSGLWVTWVMALLLSLLLSLSGIPTRYLSSCACPAVATRGRCRSMPASLPRATPEICRHSLH